MISPQIATNHFKTSDDLIGGQRAILSYDFV